MFGEKAFVHVHKEQNRTKLDPRALEMIFVGYCSDKKAFRLINPENEQLCTSRDVYFLKGSPMATTTPPQNEFNYNNERDDDFVPETAEDLNESSEEEEESNHSSSDEGGSQESEITGGLTDSDGGQISEQSFHSLEGTPRKDLPKGWQEGSPPKKLMDEDFCNPSASNILSSRTRSHVNKRSLIATQRVERNAHHYERTHRTFMASLAGYPEAPDHYDDIAGRPDEKFWYAACDSEIHSCVSVNKAWTECKLPHNRKAIGCQWVFKIKRFADGRISRYKARIVAKGYSQIKGVDFDETFAPVAQYKSLRTLLALAAIYDLEVEQLDVVTAFLIPELDEEIYMTELIVVASSMW